MSYLFVGEDEFSKDIKLQRIKQELNLAQLESFNFEILYSRDLDLKTLQERLLLLPIKAKQRLILIKDAPGLRADIKQYLLTWLSKPFSHVSLILDARRIDRRDKFFNQISGLVKQVNFHQSMEINAFTLARQIMHPVRDRVSNGVQKRIKSALRLLRQLLLQGERPERILGALRYQLQQEGLGSGDKKKRLMFLLNCDIDIKRGKLKPEFALERLLIRLCYF
jgi:DNA polymerase III delta subunit